MEEWKVILLLPLPSICIYLHAENYITTINKYANKTAKYTQVTVPLYGNSTLNVIWSEF